MTRIGPVLLALVIGVAGAGLAQWLSFPAPWLTGPALCVTIGALAGLRLRVPSALRNVCFVVIGMTVGASITPDMIATAARWPLSIAILFVAMLAIMAMGAVLLERGFGYDRTTALLGAAPGHLSFVLGLSTATSADAAAVAIIQSTRVLVLTLAVPFLAVLITGGDLGPGIAQGAAMTPAVLAVTAIGALAAAIAFSRLSVPAAYLLGGMGASAVGHLTQIGPGLVPPWLSVPAFIVMGTLIGTRFAGVGFAAIRKAFAAAMAFTALAGAVAILAGLLAAAVLGVPIVQALVAYAPGGLEAMAAMALLLGVNPAFIAAHHVSRLLLLTVLIPVVLRGAGPSRGGATK